MRVLLVLPCMLGESANNGTLFDNLKTKHSLGFFYEKKFYYLVIDDTLINYPINFIRIHS
jgi:hypothetical protein